MGQVISVRLRSSAVAVALITGTLVAVTAPPAGAAGPLVLEAVDATTDLEPIGDQVTVSGSNFTPGGSVSIRQCADVDGTLTCSTVNAVATATDAAGAFTADVPVSATTDAFDTCPEGGCVVRAHGGVGRGPDAYSDWVNPKATSAPTGPSLCSEGLVMTGLDVRMDYIGGIVADNRRIVVKAAARCGEEVAPAIGEAAGVEDGASVCPGTTQATGIVGRHGDLLDQLTLLCRETDPLGLPTGSTVAGTTAGGTGGTPFDPVSCPVGMHAVGVDGEHLNAFDNPLQSLRLVCADIGGSRVTIGFGASAHPFELVSRTPLGWSGNEESRFPAMSHDGRHVAYTSRATDIAPGGEVALPPLRYVHVHDRQATGTHTVKPMVSPTVNPNGETYDPWISGDGRYVAFTSTATNLVPADTNTTADVVLWDTQTNEYQQISLTDAGLDVTAPARLVAMSDVPRFVLFATNQQLDPTDTNTSDDLYLRDRSTSTTTLVSGSNDGVPWTGSASAGDVSNTGDVVFVSSATGLAGTTLPNSQNVYYRPHNGGAVALSSTAGFSTVSPRIAADGSTVAFVARQLVGEAADPNYQAFAYDVATATPTLVSHSSAGAPADGTVDGAVTVSPDGRHIAFSSAGSNLIAEDTDVYFDVFVHDRDTDTLRWVSRPETAGAARQATHPAVDSTGTVVAWHDSYPAYFPAGANPDNDGPAPSTPTFDVYLATHVPPVVVEPRTVTDVTLGTSPSTEGVVEAGLDTVPIAGIPVESVPFANVAIGAAPLRSIDLSAAPLRSIPLRSIPLRSIPLRSITLSQLPLQLDGGWAARLAGTPLEGLPLQTVTLAQVADLQTVPHPLDGIDLSEVGIASSPLRSIGIASIALGATPLRSIPLRSIDTSADDPDGHVCPTTGDLPATENEVLANWQALLACLGFTGTVDGTTSLIDVDIAGAPLRSIPLRSIPLRSIDLSASPLRSIPLRSIELSATPLRSIPLRSIVLDVASSPLRSIPLRSIPLRSIGTVEASPLRSIPLRSIPLRSIVVNCTDQRVDCSDDAANTQTLGDVAAIDESLITGTLEDLGDALAGFSLGDLLGVTGDATIGDVQDWLVATQGDTITLGDVLVGLLLKTDYPWEELPVADMGLQNVAPTPDHMSAALAFHVSGTPVPGDEAVITVTLPQGAAYEPGSSELVVTTLTDTLGSTSLDVRDPAVSGNVLTYTPGGDLAGSDVTLEFDYRPGVRLVEEQVSATVTIGAPAGDPEVTGTVTAATYAVDERSRNDDDPGVAPMLTSADTLVVGHIATPGDIDYYRIPASLVAGKRVSIDLAVPGVDQDLVLYAPAGADGVIDAAPLRSIPLRSIAVEDEGAVTPGTTVPPETLQDVPLRSIPLRSISANRDATNEAVDVLANEDPDGHYTIQVSGYNGATSTEPYVLRLRATDPPAELQCSPRTLPHAATAPTTATIAPAPAGTSTLFVVNPSRIDATYGAGEGAAVTAALDRLAGRVDLGVTGHVLAVDGDADVRAAYAAWDQDPCSPNAANAVVDAIVELVETSHATAGDTIPYVVLVGGDDVMPQARIPDLTRLSNQRDYLQDVGSDNPLAGAFATEHLLSDDPYGDRDPVPWLNRLLYVPDAALGRLVETPAEIVAAVDRFVAWEGSLDPDTATAAVPQDALVTGYDFLADGANAVADALEDALEAAATVDRTLISEQWTRQDLLQKLLLADTPPYVAAVNAHFDHYRSLPGAGNATHDESDLFTTADVVDPDGDGQTPAPNLDRRLLFSMGCHSGLSVPDVYVSGIEDADWAQTFGQQGVGAYVGNTGFGYGDTAAVALSERLMVEFAKRLDGSMSVGQAMTYAKHAYAADLGVYGAYDEKVLAEATFYGLPMFRITDQPAAPVDAPETATTAVAGANSAVASSSFALNQADLDVQSHTAPDGSTFLTSGTESPQVTSGRPITPRADRDVTAADGQPARGVLLTGLTSTETAVLRATFARAVVDHSSREPAVATDVAFPASFATVNRYRDLSGSRSQLVLLPGQFVPDEDPATLGRGTQRRFTAMSGLVYYSDDPDVLPPTFTQTSARANATTVTFAVDVADDANDVMRVLVLYRDAPGAWKSADLAWSATDGSWRGAGPVASDAIEYLVQAVDTAGNVASTTNKGFLFAAPVETVPPTVTITSPTAETTYLVGAAVPLHFACDDAHLDTCTATLNGEPVSDGQMLDTTTPAALQQLTVTATDLYGNATTQSVTFNVGYQFGGFAAPVASGGRTEVRAGSAVPVRWQLQDMDGSVSDRTAIVGVTSHPLADCGQTSTTTATLATTTEISGLTYDSDTDQWQYVWKTDKSWRGECRQLVVSFSDGQTASAVFWMR